MPIVFALVLSTLAEDEIEIERQAHKTEVRAEKLAWLYKIAGPRVFELYGLDLSTDDLFNLYSEWGYPVHTSRGKITMNNGYLYVEKQVLKEILTKENNGNA